MARLNPQQVTRAGIAPGFAAANAGGDTLVNEGTPFLHVKNASGGPIDVTVGAAAACSHGTVHNEVANVPANSERLIGPFPRDRFGSEPSVAYSAAAGVTVGAFRA